MVVEINGHTVGECYREALFKMRVYGRDESSRAGRVLTIQDPVVMTLSNPRSRALRDPLRNANPFFHVMEVVWMFAGSNQVRWLSQFNKRMGEFANNGILHAAYGYRWAQADQINKVAGKLRASQETRQAVISMWDPYEDNYEGFNDYPCNTHIYFRVVKGHLDMTVCNRSNDLVWGMLGANVVHMTYLQELVSNATCIPLGNYRVFTNNLHMYERHWQLLDYASSVSPYDHEAGLGPHLLVIGETVDTFGCECQSFISSHFKEVKNEWLRTVALPMYLLYTTRNLEYLRDIRDPAWREACREWLSRRSGSTGTPFEYDDTTPSA